MQEKNKKWVIAIFIVCVIALIGFFTKDFFTRKTAGDLNNINDLQSAYSIEIEQKQILEKLKTNVSKAEIFTTQDNKERQVIITFDGLTDSTTIQRILDILKKHEAKATFFVDGMQSAENPSILVNIKNSGQKIENYTLFGRRAMEKLTQEELVKDFAKTQKIISVNTDKTATFLKCNDTIYTDEILKVAKACGLNSAVKSDVYLNIKQLNSRIIKQGFKPPFFKQGNRHTRFIFDWRFHILCNQIPLAALNGSRNTYTAFGKSVFVYNFIHLLFC